MEYRKSCITCIKIDLNLFNLKFVLSVMVGLQYFQKLKICLFDVIWLIDYKSCFECFS